MKPRHAFHLLLVLAAGCHPAPPVQPPPPLNFSRFHEPGFPWPGVARVVLMPLVDESEWPRAAVEMREALASELQRLGRFEVVLAPPDPYAQLSKKIRQGGRFDEPELVALARHHRADVIVLGAVTRYRPYQRPQIGLTLQAVSPDEGKVIASVDGLWDSTFHDIAGRARRYYLAQRTCGEVVCNYVTDVIDTDYASDVVLDSPHLYRRFVAFEASLALVLDVVPRGKNVPGWLPGSPRPPHPPGPYRNDPLIKGVSIFPWKTPCPPGQPPAEKLKAPKKVEKNKNEMSRGGQPDEKQKKPKPPEEGPPLAPPVQSSTPDL
jgi:hypothetical protein